MGDVNCQTNTISSCFAVECQINVKLMRYLRVGILIFLFSIIRHPRLPPIVTVSPKMADNRGKTIYTPKVIYIYICVCVCVCVCMYVCVFNILAP